jgi:antitoxin FitA
MVIPQGGRDLQSFNPAARDVSASSVWQILSYGGGLVVAQLIVRGLPVQLVQALKRRAAMHNRSAEQEHRVILKAALRGTTRRPLAAVLKAIPNVGEDCDFGTSRRIADDSCASSITRPD